MALKLKDKSRKERKVWIDLKTSAEKIIGRRYKISCDFNNRKCLKSPLEKIKKAREIGKISSTEETSAIAKHFLKKYDKTFRNLAK